MTSRTPVAPLQDSELTREQLETAKMLRLNGVLADGFRVGMRAWKLFQAHLPFSLHLMAMSSVPPRLRELAIIRVAHNNGCDYELRHHSQVALSQLGVSEEEVEQVKQGGEGLPELEQQVIRIVDELAADCNLSDDLYEYLNNELGEETFTELMFTIGNYESMTRVLNVFKLPLDKDFDKMHGLSG